MCVNCTRANFCSKACSNRSLFSPTVDQAGTPPAVEAELSDNASDTSADSDESEESVSDPPDWTSVLLQYAGVSDGLGDFEASVNSQHKFPHKFVIAPHICCAVTLRLFFSAN